MSNIPLPGLDPPFTAFFQLFIPAVVKPADSKSPGKMVKAGLNALKASCSSRGSPPVVPPVRSPRQWCGTCPMMSCSVCVVIGPFMG